MDYAPKHIDHTEADAEEWDGADPITHLEEQLDRYYASQDAKQATLAATGRVNRKDIRDTVPQQRRFQQANKPLPEKAVLKRPANDFSAILAEAEAIREEKSMTSWERLRAGKPTRWVPTR